MRYWVVGGEYRDCGFEKLIPGTEIAHGPYSEEWRAKEEWHRLTFHDHWTPTQRFTIAVEPETQH